MRETGIYKKIGNQEYFIPHSLPPKNPSLIINAEMMALYGEASFALGQLNEMSQRLPDATRFIKAYVIKEALLSSSIEGIHTTLIEILTTSLEGAKPSKDTQLVFNYTQALESTLHMLEAEGLPLVVRVILKAHERLMIPGGEKSTPGIFRKQSVRVGELVPPPAMEVANLMSDLERYLNEKSEIPPLIDAGLVHVYFETIHPFLDGNGRIGRLLIVLMLIAKGLLKLPILYPSYYFKKHHSEYYEKLDRVRTHGDYEGWIIYYLKAIKESAIDAHIRAKEVENLELKLKTFVKDDNSFTKMRGTAASVLELLFSNPITTISEISQKSGKAYNTVHNILHTFIKQGIVIESNINKRNKMYRFEPYLELLEKEYSHTVSTSNSGF